MLSEGFTRPGTQFSCYVTPKVTYGANDVYLTLTPTPSSSGGLGAAFTTGQSAAISNRHTVTTLLTNQHTVLDAQSGTSNGILEVNGQPDPGVWIRGIGGTGGAYGAGLYDNGVLIGGGDEIRPGLIVGGAFGSTYMHTKTDLQQIGTRAYGLYGYSLYNNGPLFVSGSLSAGTLDMSSNRNLEPTGLVATGSASGWYGGLTTKAGWRLTQGISFLMPYVGADYLHTDRDAFTESGAGPLDLTYGSVSYNIGTFSTGVRAGLDWHAKANLVISPWVEVGAVAYVGDRNQNVPVTLGTVNETLPSTTAPASASVISAGLAVMSTTNWSVDLTYSGQFSNDSHMNSVGFKALYRW